MRLSKPQIRLRIRAVKGIRWHMRLSKNRDQTAHPNSKRYKMAYAPIEASDQTAHPRCKRYKLANAPIEASDQTAHPRSKRYKMAYAPIEDS